MSKFILESNNRFTIPGRKTIFLSFSGRDLKRMYGFNPFYFSLLRYRTTEIAFVDCHPDFPEKLISEIDPFESELKKIYLDCTFEKSLALAQMGHFEILKLKVPFSS